MNFNETLMWKEINETPSIFKSIQAENAEVMANLVKNIKKNNKNLIK